MPPHAGNATSPTAGQVVLHADDLGLNCAVTDGVLHGFRCGLLTSTSLMANAPDADRALDEWQRLLDEQGRGNLPSAEARRRLGDPAAAFDLGIHLNLTQGRPLSGAAYPAELLDAAGRFPGVWQLFRRLWRPRPGWLAAVQAELARQIERIVDRGLRPTHLNGHQYVEMLPDVAAMLPELLERYAIPVVRVAVERSLLRSTVLRSLAVPQWLLAHVKGYYARRFRRRMDAIGIAHPDIFFGTAHAGRIDLRLIKVFLAHVGRSETPSQERRSETPSYCEIGLHPALALSAESPPDIADGWHDPLAAYRPRELQLLLSPELAEALYARQRRLGRLSALAGRQSAPRRAPGGSPGMVETPSEPASFPGLTPGARQGGTRQREEA
jgi:chitin disaccharide deacetylase